MICFYVIGDHVMLLLLIRVEKYCLNVHHNLYLPEILFRVGAVIVILPVSTV